MLSHNTNFQFSKIYFQTLLKEKKKISLLFLHMKCADILTKGLFQYVTYETVSGGMCTCWHLTFLHSLTDYI